MFGRTADSVAGFWGIGGASSVTDFEKFQEDCQRTSAPIDDGVRSRLAMDAKLVHGMIGLAGETGELADAVKRHVYYGQPLDVVNVVEECGDCLWYLAEVLEAVGADFDKVIRKLKARYPEKFDAARAADRDLGAERKELGQLASAIGDVITELTARLHDARKRFEQSVQAGVSSNLAEAINNHATSSRIQGEIATLEDAIGMLGTSLEKGMKQ